MLPVSMNATVGEVDDDGAVVLCNDASEHVAYDWKGEEVRLSPKSDDRGISFGGQRCDQGVGRECGLRELRERHRLASLVGTRKALMRYQGPEQRSRRVPS